MSSDENVEVISNTDQAWAELEKGKAFRANTDYLSFGFGALLHCVVYGTKSRMLIQARSLMNL